MFIRSNQAYKVSISFCLRNQKQPTYMTSVKEVSSFSVHRLMALTNINWVSQFAAEVRTAILILYLLAAVNAATKCAMVPIIDCSINMPIFWLFDINCA